LKLLLVFLFKLPPPLGTPSYPRGRVVYLVFEDEEVLFSSHDFCSTIGFSPTLPPKKIFSRKFRGFFMPLAI
jgi:hypothetical protein